MNLEWSVRMYQKTQLKTIYQLSNPDGIEALISAVRFRGYDIIGPTVRDDTIMLAPIQSMADLPRGISDQQDGGKYRIQKNEGDLSFFGYNLGPSSWKAFLFPENRRLWRITRNENPDSDPVKGKPMAFFGVRACEISAIAIQDKVFIREGGDLEYRRRRESLLIVGVHCRTAASTCFCSSMGTGPEFSGVGVDLLITEVNDQLLVEALTEKGRPILESLPIKPTSEHARHAISEQLKNTLQSITRKMDQTNIKETIYSSITSHNWDDVGARCLSCANCTLVCPTCFCSTVEDISDVEDNHAERWQKWDSCFHVDFSYVHGGARRQTTASRYRQWFTHKLASWHDQFQSSGCVGCGRCIAWCPVGIDLTAEMEAIRKSAPYSSKENFHD